MTGRRLSAVVRGGVWVLRLVLGHDELRIGDDFDAVESAVKIVNIVRPGYIGYSEVRRRLASVRNS